MYACHARDSTSTVEWNLYHSSKFMKHGQQLSCSGKAVAWEIKVRTMPQKEKRDSEDEMVGGHHR